MSQIITTPNAMQLTPGDQVTLKNRNTPVMSVIALISAGDVLLAQLAWFDREDRPHSLQADLRALDRVSTPGELLQ